MRRGNSILLSKIESKEDNKEGKNTCLTFQAAFSRHFIENPKWEFYKLQCWCGCWSCLYPTGEMFSAARPCHWGGGKQPAAGRQECGLFSKTPNMPHPWKIAPVWGSLCCCKDGKCFRAQETTPFGKTNLMQYFGFPSLAQGLIADNIIYLKLCYQVLVNLSTSLHLLLHLYYNFFFITFSKKCYSLSMYKGTVMALKNCNRISY